MYIKSVMANTSVIRQQAAQPSTNYHLLAAQQELHQKKPLSILIFVTNTGEFSG